MNRVTIFARWAFLLTLSLTGLNGVFAEGTATIKPGRFAALNSAVTAAVPAAPSITSFAASPAAIAPGASSTLTAVFANGTGFITPGNIAISSGSPVTVTPALTTLYTLVVTNAAGVTAMSSATITVTPPAPVITSFTVGTSSILPGASTTLTAVFSNGNGYIEPGNLAVTSGVPVTVTPLDTTKYTLVVVNSAGVLRANAASVGVAPATPVITSFTAGSASILSGASTTLTAVFSNGSGFITPGNLAVTSGTPVTVTPPYTTKYTLTIINAAGVSRSANASVGVAPATPAITSFTASPSSIAPGASSALTAVFANGTGVIMPGNIAVTNGTPVTVKPTDTTTYTLDVYNSAGVYRTSWVVVNVATGTQTITFANPGAQTVGTPLTLKATASSGLTVSFASTTSSVCTVSGTTATFVAAGSCSITASQAGNATYAAATPVSQSFTVSGGAKTAQTITFANPGTQTVGTPLTLSATATSGLTVAFASTTASVCTVSGTAATFVAAGTCTIQATQAGNSTYAAATPVSQSFTVNASSSNSDPTSGVLPSYNDTYANWKNAGLALVGGIPNRTTVCATVNPLGGGQDDFTNIQNAINNCPAGQVVQLGAGQFTVHVADLPIQISTGIVLRGANCSGANSPYCQTSITVSDGALAYTSGMCGTDTSHEVTCPNGGPPELLIAPVSPAYNYSWAQCGNAGSAVGTGCGAIPLDTDAAQGQTTIQIHSTSNFSVGQWVLIDEASGAGWVADPLNAWTNYGQVWAASDWLSSSGSPAAGRVMWPKSQNGGGWDFGSTYPYQADSTGCWWSYCDRPTAELHLITAIGAGPCPGANCTLTFDDPLTVAFRQTGNHNAQVYSGPYPNQSGTGSPISFVQYAGVENISLLRAVNGGIGMELCAYCWAKNVEVGDWYGGGISMGYSARSELNNVYVHHCWDSVNNGGEYPLDLGTASTEMLITNSITNFAGKGMVARAGGAGSVVSYNYVDDTMYDAESGIGDYWIDMGVNASHFSGPHHVLFEGNWGDNLDSDHTHGSSDYMTFFRNQGTGLRTSFVDPNIGKTVDDFAGTAFYCPSGLASCVSQSSGPLRAAGPSAYSYWFAFVGNVLGLAGETTAANGWTYQGDWSGKRVFMLGWNDGAGGQDPYLNGVSGSYIFRHGNYDYVNGAVTWDSGTPDHTLPNSFYLSSKPAFFNAGSGYPWPWVTPTGSTQIQNGPSGCGGTCSGLPAQARWQAGTPFVQP